MTKLCGPHEVKEYDYDRIVGIVESLFFLKGEAKKTGNEDIEILIQSTFNILMTTYCLILRNNSQKLKNLNPDAFNLDLPN